MVSVYEENRKASCGNVLEPDWKLDGVFIVLHTTMVRKESWMSIDHGLTRVTWRSRELLILSLLLTFPVLMSIFLLCVSATPILQTVRANSDNSQKCNVASDYFCCEKNVCK